MPNTSLYWSEVLQFQDVWTSQQELWLITSSKVCLNQHVDFQMQMTHALTIDHVWLHDMSWILNVDCFENSFPDNAISLLRQHGVEHLIASCYTATPCKSRSLWTGRRVQRRAPKSRVGIFKGSASHNQISDWWPVNPAGGTIRQYLHTVDAHLSRLESLTNCQSARCDKPTSSLDLTWARHKKHLPAPCFIW